MKCLRSLFCLLWVSLLFGVLPVFAGAAAADPNHKPVITVLALNAPRDQQVSIRLVKEGESYTYVLHRERRAWETLYRFYRNDSWAITRWYGNAYDLKDAVLLVESGGEELTVPIPNELLSSGGYDDYLTLHLREGRLSGGFPSWRGPALVLFRVLACLLAETAVFLVFRYRRLRSWLVFLIFSLLSLGLVSLLVDGWINVTPRHFVLPVLAVPLMVLAGLAVFVAFIDETPRDRTVVCSALTNLTGAGLMLILIFCFPL